MQQDAKYWENLGDRLAITDWHGYPELGRNGNSRKAQFYYRQAVDLEPQNAAVWAKLSNQAVDEEALEYINKAIELDPGNPTFLARKAFILSDHLIDRLDEAEAVIDQALEMAPGNLEALFVKADILRTKACELLESIEPAQNVSTLLRAADWFFKADLENQAIECLNDAITIDPDNKRLWTIKYWYLQSWHRSYEAAEISDEKLLFQYSVSIEDFCRTGEYGPVKLGMSREQIRGILGDPEGTGGRYPEQFNLELEEWSGLGDDAHPIWSYGSVELFFGEKRGLLHRISCKQLPYWRHLGYWGQTIKLEPWIYRRVHGRNDFITKDELEKALREAQIPYVDEGRETFPSHWLGYIRMKSGVEAIYEEEDGAIIVGALHHYDDRWGDD